MTCIFLGPYPCSKLRIRLEKHLLGSQEARKLCSGPDFLLPHPMTLSEPLNFCSIQRLCLRNDVALFSSDAHHCTASMCQD